MIFMTTKIHSAKRLPELPSAFISILTTKAKQESEGKMALPGSSLLTVKEIVALIHLIAS